ncbi:MAG: hypothetical protein M3Q69_16300 [Acidobacteriota bacterium]|nr:hypothetical protein [Acidobacteriota bacterium]
MARKDNDQTLALGSLQRMANAVKRLFSRGREVAESAMPETPAMHEAAPAPRENAPVSRSTRRETDIPLDVLDRTYTPPFTGGKAGFRSDGSDHSNDQEFAYGVADDRWNDEDRFTNKSGDPRIGTHRRTYEPAEARPESHE